MVKRVKYLAALSVFLLFNLLPAALIPEPAEAQVSDFDITCFTFTYPVIGSNQINTNVDDSRDECRSALGITWSFDTSATEPFEGTDLYAWTPNVNVDEFLIFDACTLQYSAQSSDGTRTPITVLGDPPTFLPECSDQDDNPELEFGNVRFQIVVPGINDLLQERSVGPFICRAHRVPALQEPYEVRIPEYSLGAMIAEETIVCDFANIQTGDYYLELIEIDEDNNEILRFTTDELAVGNTITTFYDATITIEQFEEGAVGLVQTAFAEPQQVCNSGSFNLPFRWVLCPMINLLFKSLSVLYNSLIIPALYFAPLSEDPGAAEDQTTLFAVWNNFRIIANVVFIIVFLVAIFGQSLAGFELFSAYDIKKIMPRLVIGMIGLQISWYVVGFMIDLFNVIGAGIRGLMLAPVTELNIAVNFDYESNWYELASTIGIIGGVAAGLWVGGIALGLPLILYPLIAGLILAFIVILIRRALLVILVVTSPLAFVLWILPNTSNMFKLWWGTFWKALLMYPMIIGLLASGELFARIVTAQNTAGEQTQASVFNSILAMIALFAPYFLVPFTFRFAGGALSVLSGNLDRRSKSMNKRLFGTVNDPNSLRGRRRAKQVAGQNKRKQRVLEYTNRVREGGADFAAGASARGTRRGRTAQRVVGRGLQGAGAASHFVANRTGRFRMEQAAARNTEANKKVARWMQQGNQDRVHAILGDRHATEGRYIDDGEGGRVFEGRELDPGSMQAANKDRSDPAMVQAALNHVLADAAGQEDKVQQVYENFFGHHPQDPLIGGSIGQRAVSWAIGGRTLADLPRTHSLYNRYINKYGKRYNQRERKQLLNRAADYNNKHSPDFLYRDPNNNFRMSTDPNSQNRYLTRLNNRLSADRDLDTLGPSAWRGATDVFRNAEAIYNRHAGAGHTALNPAAMSEAERGILREAASLHETVVSTPSVGQGSVNSNQARREFEQESRRIFGPTQNRSAMMQNIITNLPR